MYTRNWEQILLIMFVIIGEELAIFGKSLIEIMMEKEMEIIHSVDGQAWSLW